MSKQNPSLMSSDQKRVARGEHLRTALYYLRARDAVHHAKWRVLMLAGPEPEGEIIALKHLMPSCFIVAVDKSAQCAQRASQAGADVALHCDITPTRDDKRVLRPSGQLSKVQRFDLIDMDLCANPSEGSREMVRGNWPLLTPRGVLMLTFSYGRDVVPAIMEEWQRIKRRYIDAEFRVTTDLGCFADSEIPDTIKARIAYLVPPTHLQRLRSVIAYQGNQMPMCACLFGGSARPDKISYIKLGDEDLSNVVLAEFDPSLVYDCPQTRIEAFRRTQIARKACRTRAVRIEMENSHT